MQRGVLLVGLLLASCRCVSEPEPEPQPSRAPRATPPERCSSERVFSLGEQAPAAVEGDDREAPFGVEVGRAVRVRDRYVIPFVRGGQRASSAGLLWLGPGSEARVVELGEQRGEGGPPLVTARGDAGVVVLPEADARGGQYRVGALEAEGVSWWFDVDQDTDDSVAFDVTNAGERGFLVWDEWDRPRARGIVKLASFTLGPGAPEVRVVSPANRDVEGPRLWPRPGGAWLGWIALGAVTRSASPGAVPASDEDPTRPLTPSSSWLELLPLDEQGRPAGEPRALTSTDAHVVSFDGVAAQDGSLLLAVRESPSLAALDAGSVQLMRLGHDGSVHSEPMAAPDLGAGTPSLVFDPNPGSGAPHGWLGLAAASGSTLLAGLSPSGDLLEPLTVDETLGISGILAAWGGELLLVSPSGAGAVFSRARCRVLDAKPADAGD